jgi:NO-binding membrane sensor protein with MHYT domain
MHFTGMAALRIESEGDHLSLSYNTGVTILSLLVAIACVYLGLFISSRDRVFTKDKEELFSMLMQDAKNQSMKSIQSKSTLYRLAVLKGLLPLVIGGMVTGGGVCIMHYVGMMALTAHVSMKWNPGLVVLSIIIAVVASTAAFWILFRLLPLFPTYESLRLGSSFIMAVAVCGMHYTGMMAVTYEKATEFSGYRVGSQKMSKENAYYGALISSLILNWIFSMMIQGELRHFSLLGFKHSKQLSKLYEKYPNERPNSKLPESSRASDCLPGGDGTLKTNSTNPFPRTNSANPFPRAISSKVYSINVEPMP